ncbi:major capsid protein, partial [Ochrobactrum sp. SFR4]|uniref:major capsid protein n=1 Tax=Ochrobactrum sp. SFR4 TaxID=2717368 RepID=UPI001C8CC81F
NAFGVIEFHEEVVERIDHKPQLLGSLNLFETIYSRSRSIAIADRDRTLSLIPTSENGAPLAELIPQGAKVRKFDTVRLAKGSTIYAIELAGTVALPF